MKRKRWSDTGPWSGLALGLLVAAAPASAGGKMEVRGRPLASNIEQLRLDTPLVQDSAPARSQLDPSLLKAQGRIQVIVQLNGAPVARSKYRESDKGGAMKARLRSLQQTFVDRAQRSAPTVREIARTQIVLNAVFLEVDAGDIATLAKDPAVRRISRVGDYELHLSETVPYIGASAVQGAGFDGTGISLAVLDSGIDYTHANLGGPGTVADYNAAYADPASRDGLFPTAKVVAGFDFVGETWPGGPLAPDDDPIDFNGHGTHVADISGGLGGVAPGVALHAVKVCSAVAPSCSGIALIQGMDYAADPNGDGDTADAVDIVNMSLGAVYGQAFDDDLAQAVDNATALGILTVASAGNSADKPYVTGTPAAALTALSVAQTAVPSATLTVMEVTAPASIAGLYTPVFQPWSTPLSSLIEAPLQYGDGAGGNLNGCAPFAPGSLAGLIVLVDRGTCAFSIKIDNIDNAGGLVGIIGLVAPGAPFAGGFGGGGPILIPGYMISQADSDALKSGLPDTFVRFDPDAGVPLIMSVVGSSSRGPTMLSNRIKPEIGAPGQSVSADVGTGTGASAFGGTSGAAPMVAGSAALLMSAYPDRTPLEIKAALMNTGETEIANVVTPTSSSLAPISRIGGGEVRVDAALGTPVAAWDSDSPTGGLSFGFVDATGNNMVSQRRVTLRNFTDRAVQFSIEPTFRFAEDADTDAVRVIAPDRVNVRPQGTAQFQVEMLIRGSALHDWQMNSGSRGANGDVLTFNEYDGYLNLTSSAGDIHMPWHVLPRKSGDIRVRDLGRGNYRVTNGGAGASTVEAYSLIGSNGNLPEGGAGEQNPTPDLRHVGYATFPVPAGFCGPDDSYVMAFAVNTWERQTHANAPQALQFDLDTDQDGIADFAVFNADLSFTSLTDGRNVTFVQNLATSSASAFFFTDHITNSGNTVLLFCGDQIGQNAANFGAPMDVSVSAFDIYFTGLRTDSISGITISPLGEQYLGVFDNGGVGASTIAPKSSDRLSIVDFGATTNNTETGLLLLHRGGAPADNEASTIILAP